MRRFVKIFLVLLFIGVTHVMNAQDNPISYFQLTPLEVNPALVGNFYGTARTGVYQRLQWLNIDGGKVTNMFLDAPLPLKFLGKKNWIGFGINVLKDVSGNIDFGYRGGGMGLSFNRLLGKKGNSSISFGFQYEVNTVGFDLTKFSSLNDGLLTSGASSSPDKLGVERANDKKYSNFNLGVVYKSRLNKKSSLSTGIALNNILQPDIALSRDSIGTANGQSSGLQRNINGFFEYSQQISKKTKFEPALYFEKQGKSFRTVLQANFAYLLNPKKKLILNGGFGYQHNSNIHMILGADIGDLNIGLSYGMPFSGVSISEGYQSTMELGVSYIIKYYKKPKVDPVLFCPRF